MRTVVVGAGVMGAATAWRLAQRGVDVTLLEQFEPGHVRGASHGSARIFRLAYAEPEYVRLAQRGHDGWRELEAATGAELLTITGGVDHGDREQLGALHAALTGAGAEAAMLSADAAAVRFPGLRFDGDVLWHACAGRTHADRAVAACKAAAAALGAEVRHGAPVTAIDDASVATAAGERIDADAIVVAAGGWTRRLLGERTHLPALRVTLEQPAHFAPLDPAMPWPSFIHHPGPGGTAIYGLDSDDGVKIGLHKAGDEIDPDDDRVLDHQNLAALQRYVRTWVPGVDASSADPTQCTYTLSPDEHPIIDRDGAVTVLAGFSGHGFKFAPAFGELAAGLVLDGVQPSPTFALGPRAPDPVRPPIR